MAAPDDFDAQDRALTARMRLFLGHIEDMGDDERLFMLGALTGALERHLNPAPATLMRPGRHLSLTPGLCTLYRVTGDDWEEHECVGMVATPAIAEAVCEAVNARGVPLPTGSVKDPEAGDFVKLSGKIISIHEGTALVEVYRSDPPGLRVPVQCGALEHVEVTAGDDVTSEEAAGGGLDDGPRSG